MYAKVFASMWDGTLYGQADAQLVFVFLLARCGPDGVVEVTVPAIAAPTGLTPERVRSALDILESPDPGSRTPDADGARLLRLDEHRDWGWTIVNYERYRNIRDPETRRQQVRDANRRLRDRRRSDVIVGEPCEPRRAQAEAEAEAEESNPPTPLGRPRSARPEREPEGFADFYQVYPRRDGRRAAARAFEQALRRRPDYRASDLLAAAREFAGMCERSGAEQRFIPLPATWLNQDRFREFFDEEESDGRDPEGHPDPPEGEPSGT